MKTINFLHSGKLGDFVHAMFAIKNICYKYNAIANIFIRPGDWTTDVYTTHKELYPIVSSQKYVNSFSILDHQDLNKDAEYINLDFFRESKNLYKNSWTDMFLLDYDLVFKDYRWIDFDETDRYFTNRIIINRKTSDLNIINHNFPYQQIIDNYDTKPIFISSQNQQQDYYNFPFKDQCEHVIMNNIKDFFVAINSCKVFIGNLSGPLAIACSIDKHRIAELSNTFDHGHYISETKYSNNISWFLNSDTYYNLDQYGYKK
jgi:hypothetical protein